MYDYTRQGTLLYIENVSLTLESPTLGKNMIIRDLTETIENIVRPGMAQGQVIALLGPSGVGKTQLFRMLAGLQKPTSGRVLVNTSGNDQAQLTEVVAGQVGVVAQRYPLFKRLKVLENLMLAGSQAGLKSKEAKEKAMDFLIQFGLQNHLNHYPSQLSGGQQQRVAIAQQLMCSEYFLLMDEPYSGLDPLRKRTVSSLVRKVSTMNELNTTIITTHDIPMAVIDADEIWVLGFDKEEGGNKIPGARIKAKYDTIERGLAWRPDIKRLPQFIDTVREIEELFDTLE
jgi:polar amino acid transport system ATP-binding protein/sulfate transport system ATP-binding protein